MNPLLDRIDYSSNALEMIVSNLYEGAFIIDSQRQIIAWNQSAERITGLLREQVINQICNRIRLNVSDVDGNNLCHNASCPFSKVIHSGEPCSMKGTMQHRQGFRIPVKFRCMPLKNRNGDIRSSIILFDEVSQNEELVSQVRALEKLANIDPLTNLPNRRFIESTLKQRIEEFERYGWPFALFMADVDHFKKVNDTYGHEVGDDVLLHVSQSLSSGLRSFDIVGRYGGDEMLGIVKNVARAELELILNRLIDMVRQVSVVGGGGLVKVSLSVGATMTIEGDTIQTLMERTDAALYVSKHQGRDRVTVV